MSARREKSKPQKPHLRSAQGDASLAKNKQLEEAAAEPLKPQVNHRQEKFADFLIDVANMYSLA